MFHMEMEQNQLNKTACVNQFQSCVYNVKSSF